MVDGTGLVGLAGDRHGAPPRRRCGGRRVDHPRRAARWPARHARPRASPTRACCTSMTSYDRPDGDAAIVREWAAGTTLVDRLAGRTPTRKKPACSGIQVARALAASHEGGVTHEALGPGDVLITEERPGQDRRACCTRGRSRMARGRAPSPTPGAAGCRHLRGGDRTLAGGRPRRAGRCRRRGPRRRAPDRCAQEFPSRWTGAHRGSDGPGRRPGTMVGHALEDVLAELGRRASDAARAAATGGGEAATGALAGDAWRVSHRGRACRGCPGRLPARPGTTSPPERRRTPGPPRRTSTAASASPTPTDASQRIPVIDGADFDPKGNGQENSELVPLAFDDNLATAWRTVSYNQADLAPKPGWAWSSTWARSRTSGRCRMNLVGAGTSFEVRVAETLGDRRKDFQPFGSGTNVGDVVAVRSEQPIPARYVLVWLTGLPADGETYRGWDRGDRRRSR